MKEQFMQVEHSRPMLTMRTNAFTKLKSPLKLKKTKKENLSEMNFLSTMWVNQRKYTLIAMYLE